MLSYIVRRLLLMIPTLIGITFLVFMLLALSPGGIGASLRVSGGQMEASKAAVVEAYLEDRYGLDDPVLVQYVRWLGRISPIKFGARDQVDYLGELVRRPKSVKPLPLPDAWFAGLELDASERAAVDELRRERTDGEWGDAVAAARAAAEERVVEGASTGADPAAIPEFKDADRVYAKMRAEYLVARKDLARVLVAWARDREITGVTKADGTADFDAVGRLDEVATTPDARTALRATMLARGRAVAARDRFEAAFERGPYSRAGLPIIPDVLSLAMPDFGKAFSRGRPVKDLIADALPVTLLLNLVAVPLIYLIAIPSGMLAARYRGSWFDVSSGALFVALWSIPTVWAGVLAIGYLADERYLGWFPVSGLHAASAENMPYLPTWTDGEFVRGWLLDTLWHVVLPVACLVYAGFAILAKQTRASMLDNFSMDYVRTARAKGVSDRDVTLRHVFRNSLLPIITIFVTVFPAMLAGSVVIEKIFTVPGMGSLILDAINLRDRELILANTFMVAVVNLLALLLADLLYAVADPRVSFE